MSPIVSEEQPLIFHIWNIKACLQASRTCTTRRLTKPPWVILEWLVPRSWPAFKNCNRSLWHSDASFVGATSSSLVRVCVHGKKGFWLKTFFYHARQYWLRHILISWLPEVSTAANWLCRRVGICMSVIYKGKGSHCQPIQYSLSECCEAAYFGPCSSCMTICLYFCEDFADVLPEGGRGCCIGFRLVDLATAFRLIHRHHHYQAC